MSNNDDIMLHNKLFGDIMDTNTCILEDDAAIVEKIKSRKMRMITPEKVIANIEEDIGRFKVSFTKSINKLETIGNESDHKCAELKLMTIGNPKFKKQADELQNHMMVIKHLVNEFRTHYNTSTLLLTTRG